jgi:hypothetical protein
MTVEKPGPSEIVVITNINGRGGVFIRGADNLLYGVGRVPMSTKEAVDYGLGLSKTLQTDEEIPVTLEDALR